MAGAFPHKADETVYYVRQYGFTFPVKKIDPVTGRAIQKTNPATGQPLFLPNGNPDIVEIFYDFKQWKNKFCADGYVSVYVVDKNTDPLVKEEIEKMAADRGSQVMTEKQFIKTVNPELYDQMKANEKNEALHKEKDAKLATLTAEVDALRKKLQGRN
jgi:hypothetical protein